MAKTQELLELAERCEKATGPDLALDEAIAESLEPGLFTRDPQGRLRKNLHGTILTPQWDLWHAPAYTASLDAAMTLAPEGDDICLTMGEGPWVGHFARIWKLSAELAVEGKDACEWEVCSSAPLGLALALCAASLRARCELS